MVRRISPDEEKALADGLKREAAASRPRFSEPLHARICRAVSVRRAEAGVQSLRRRVQWRLASAAAAASALVCAALVAWAIYSYYLPGPATQPPELAGVERENLDPLGELGAIATITNNTASDVGRLVEANLTANQWAYLDHDARVAVDLLMDHLPWDMLASTQEP
jgi:hypothetical protein